MSVLGPYALATLSDLKSWVGETSSANDTLYERAINYATALIESYIGRRIRARDYVFWLDGHGSRSVKLPEYPIVATNFVGYGSVDAIEVVGSDSTDADALVSVGPLAGSVLDASVRLVRAPAPPGAIPTTTSLSTATHPRTSSMATQIAATAGFSATVLHEAPSRYLHRTGPKSVAAVPYRLTIPDRQAIEWRMDAERGILHVTRTYRWWPDDDRSFPREWQAICVDCRAGFDPVPDAIKFACLELAAAAYRNRVRDQGVASESLGDYSYSLRAQTDAITAMEETLVAWRELR